MQVKIRQSRENLSFIQHAKEIAKIRTNSLPFTVFYLKTSDNNLTITVSDPTTGLTYRCNLETEEINQKGKALVDAPALTSILSSLPEEENEIIEFKIDKNKLILKQKHRKYTLPLVDTYDIPEITPPADLKSINTDALQAITECLKKAYQFCNKEDSYREALQYVLIKQINEQTLDIVGISDTCGCFCSINTKLPFLNPGEDIKIHNKHVPEIIKFTSTSEEIKANIEDNKLYLVNQNQDILKIPLASNISFPDYKQLCNNSISGINTILIFEENPEPAIKRLIKITEKQTFSTAFYIQPDTENSVILKAGETKTGEEKIKVSFQKQKLNRPLALNIKEFHRILKILNSSKNTIKLGISEDREKPVCIRENDDKNLLVLIAPVLVDEEEISVEEEIPETETVEENE